jgi:hypothetical protein
VTPDYRSQLAALVASGILSEAQAQRYLGGPLNTSEPVHVARERPAPRRQPRKRRSLRCVD